MARALVITLGFVGTARAQDAFEIQVYDTQTALRGESGLETHCNVHLLPSAPDQIHLTFEPHYGVTSFIELGAYVQTSLATDGDLDYAGVKLRAKLRWPQRVWDQRIGLAINFELSAIPSEFEANVWGSEVRPIVDLRIADVYAAVNPIVATDLAGPEAGRPQFEPAVKLAWIANHDLMLGAEAYGGFGPFDDIGRERVVRLYAVADLQGTWWDLNAGVGATWNSPDHPIVKMIFGVHPRGTPPDVTSPPVQP